MNFSSPFTVHVYLNYIKNAPRIVYVQMAWFCHDYFEVKSDRKGDYKAAELWVKLREPRSLSLLLEPLIQVLCVLCVQNSRTQTQAAQPTVSAKSDWFPEREINRWYYAASMMRLIDLLLSEAFYLQVHAAARKKKVEFVIESVWFSACLLVWLSLSKPWCRSLVISSYIWFSYYTFCHFREF